MRRRWPLVGAVVAVAATYTVGRLVAAVVVDALRSTSSSVSPGAEIVAGVLVGLTLVVFAWQLGGPTWLRVAVIGLAAFVNVAAVMIEGAAFAPDLSPPGALPVGLAAQLGVSLAAGAAAVVLVPGDRTAGILSGSSRGPVGVALRVAAAALIYVVLYFVTGALNYALITGPYYETHTGGLVTPAPSVVAVVAVTEGFILAIGMAPLARLLRGAPRTRTLVCGLGLFVLGGAVPLIQQTNLPDVIRVASTVEIFFQKFPLGVAVALLLGPAAERRT